MKIIFPVTLALTALVSACAVSPLDKVNVQTHSVHNYQCQSGETVAATYPTTDSATVQYKGSSYKMQIAVSASGARYVGGELEWWTKGSGPGSEGVLFRHMADGTTGESIELCSES